VLPGLQLSDQVLLVGQQLASESADLRKDAGTGLVGGQLAAGAGSRRHDLDERPAEGGSVQPGQPFQVGLAAGIDALVAVAMGR
jgi:hypothetical protein